MHLIFYLEYGIRKYILVIQTEMADIISTSTSQVIHAGPLLQAHTVLVISCITGK